MWQRNEVAKMQTFEAFLSVYYAFREISKIVATLRAIWIATCCLNEFKQLTAKTPISKVNHFYNHYKRTACTHVMYWHNRTVHIKIRSHRNQQRKNYKLFSLSELHTDLVSVVMAIDSTSTWPNTNSTF